MKKIMLILFMFPALLMAESQTIPTDAVFRYQGAYTVPTWFEIVVLGDGVQVDSNRIDTGTTAFYNGTVAVDIDAYSTAGVKWRANYSGDSVLAYEDITAFIRSDSVNDAITDANKSNFMGTGDCSGNGAFTRYIVLLDTSGADSTPVSGAKISANNTAQTGTPYNDLTDNNGRAVLNLDAGDWVIFHTAPAYQSIIDTITVSETGTDTLLTYTSSSGKAAVYGFIYNSLGGAYSYATAEFRLIAVPVDSILKIGDTIVTQRQIIDTADVNGYFAALLYPNETLSDSSYYRVTFRDRYGAQIEQFWNAYVPDTSSVEFENLSRWR